MNLSALFRARVHACLRDVLSLVFLILALFIALAAAFLTAEKNADRLSVGLVNEDSGTYGAILSDSLQGEDYMTLTALPRETAMTLLRQDRLEAVIIIRENFSSSLELGEFENTLELYTAPSSGAGLTVSEPVINKTIILWVKEFALLTAEKYLAESGDALTDEEREAFREKVNQIWRVGSGIEVQTVYLDNTAPETESGSISIFSAAVSWYAVFCMFYLIAGASWVLDTKNNRLRIRAKRAGVKAWALTFTSALAPLLLALLGYIVAGTAVCAAFSLPLSTLLRCLPPIAVYLSGALGITLVFATALGDITTLLFFAPVLTFLNAALSGMILPLPEWANVLSAISSALPGHWLQSAMDGNPSALFFACICALGWIGLSGLVSSFTNRKENHFN